MKGCFIGRARELDFLLGEAASSGTGHVINLFGCAGVGKSQLLLRFAEELAERQVPVVGLDPGEVERAVGEGADGLNHLVQELASRGSAARPVLIIDGYNPPSAVDAAMRSKFLAKASSTALTVIATRQPLSDRWGTDPAALSRLESIHLLPFSPEETREYLGAQGVTDLSVLDQIVTFAGGLPLALALAVDCAREAQAHFAEASAGSAGLGPISLHKAAQRIVRRLAEEIPDDELWSLIEAASVVRRANEESLGYLVGRAVSALTLNRLCEWSGLRLTEEGLALQPGIRQAVLEDLRWRAPGRYAGLRERAAAWVAGDGPETVERVRLVGDPYLQSYLLTGGGERILSCSGPPPEAEEVVRATRGWLHTYLCRPADGAGGIVEHLLALLAECPEAFVPVRDGRGTLLGFTCVIPVEPRLLPLLMRFAVTACYLEKTENPLRPARVFLYPAFVENGQDYEARGALIRACLERQIKAPLRVVAVTWVHDPMAARRAEQILFSRVPGLTFLGYGAHLPVTYYELDVTQCEPRQWVERIAAGLQGKAAAAPPTLAALRPAVAAALHGYWQDGQLEKNPLTRLAPVRARVRASAAEGGPPGAAEALRLVLGEALDELAQGQGPTLFRHGAEEARVLRLAYVERLGSHERAMERLGLPRTTYYRRLRAGLDHLAATFIAWESLNKRPSG